MRFAGFALLMLLTLTTGTAHGLDTTVQLLEPQSGERAQAQALWRALRSGDERSLATVGAQLFTAPSGRAQQEGGLIERWNQALARAISELSDADAAKRRLDQLLRRELEHHQPAEHARIAALFVPAPLALGLVRQAAWRAFDQGDFAGYLQREGLIHNQLMVDAAGHEQTRQAVARDYVLANPNSAWWSALPEPGPRKRLSSNQWQYYQEHREQGLRLAIKRIDEWLVGMDGFAHVRWQRPLPQRSQVSSGAGGAIIHNSSGVSLISEQGRAQSLQMPRQVQTWGIAGGAAWFSKAQTAYRLDLENGQISSFALPAQPITAPIVRGQRSLWLSSDEWFVIDNAELHGRYLHGLEINADWRLSQGHFYGAEDYSWAQPAVVLHHPDQQQHWQILPFPHHSAPLLSVAHYNRASRFRDAISTWERLERADRLATSNDFAAALSALGESGRQLWPWSQAKDWISDPGWRLRVAVAQLPLTSLDDQQRHEIADLAEAAGDLVLPLAGAKQPFAGAEKWPYSIHARALASLVAQTAPQPLSASQTLQQRLPAGLPIVDQAQPLTQAPPTPSTFRQQRQAGKQSRLFIDDHLVTLDFATNGTRLSVHSGEDEESTLLWSQGWETPSYLPGRSIGYHREHLLVAEGQSRLHAYNRHHGARYLRTVVPNGLAMPSQVRLLDGQQLAIFHPISVNNKLTIVAAHKDAAQRYRDFTLPASKQWSVVLGEEILVALSDGSLRAYPSDTEIPWPGPLPSQAPRLGSDGLYGEDHWWPFVSGND